MAKVIPVDEKKQRMQILEKNKGWLGELFTQPFRCEKCGWPVDPSYMEKCPNCGHPRAVDKSKAAK